MSEKSQKAVELVTELLKAHPDASNISIADALGRAGCPSYPSLIAKVRKDLGIPSKRGRKPGAKTEKKPEQPAEAKSKPQRKKAAAPARAPEKDWMEELNAVVKAANEVGGLLNLVGLSSYLLNLTRSAKS